MAPRDDVRPDSQLIGVSSCHAFPYDCSIYLVLTLVPCAILAVFDSRVDLEPDLSWILPCPLDHLSGTCCSTSRFDPWLPSSPCFHLILWLVAPWLLSWWWPLAPFQTMLLLHHCYCSQHDYCILWTMTWGSSWSKVCTSLWGLRLKTNESLRLTPHTSLSRSNRLWFREFTSLVHECNRWNFRITCDACVLSNNISSVTCIVFYFISFPIFSLCLYIFVIYS